MRKRKKLSKRSSIKKYRKGQKVHKKNLRIAVSRGGFKI